MSSPDPARQSPDNPPPHRFGPPAPRHHRALPWVIGGAAACVLLAGGGTAIAVQASDAARTSDDSGVPGKYSAAPDLCDSIDFAAYGDAMVPDSPTSKVDEIRGDDAAVQRTIVHCELAYSGSGPAVDNELNVSVRYETDQQVAEDDFDPGVFSTDPELYEGRWTEGLIAVSGEADSIIVEALVRRENVIVETSFRWEAEDYDTDEIIKGTKDITEQFVSIGTSSTD